MDWQSFNIWAALIGAACVGAGTTWLVRLAHHALEEGKDILEMLGPTALDFDLAAVGWSAGARGPVGFFLSTIERPGTPAFKVIETDNLITPSTDEMYQEIMPLLAYPGRFDAERNMVAIAEKQRQIVEPYGSKRITTSLVGGFLQLTTVTEHEITTRIIHRWPDKIGGWINGAATA
jgi:hypothetical protein